MQDSHSHLARRRLNVCHAASVCIGMVAGAGNFKTAPNAAANMSSGAELMFAWIFGGVASLIPPRRILASEWSCC